MNNPSISGRESQVISEIVDRDMVIFSPRDVRRFLDVSQDNVYRIIQNMERKGLVSRIERGKYILTEVMKKLDILEIVSDIFSPSYIAFWSALHYHKMTDQVPRKVFVATTKRKRPLKFQGQKVKYVTISEDLFFGYKRYGKIIVSDKEKTVIDCLRHPRYAGGVEHIYESIDRSLDLDRIYEYCEKIGSTTLASRLGYMLEKKGIINDGRPLREMITTYTKLDPEGGRENPDPRWKIYANRGI